MKQSTTFRTASRRTALKALIAAPAALSAVSAWRPFNARANEAADPASLGTLNFIVGGVDFRSYEEPENSDVLMIARVDLINSTVRAVVIPRDLWVAIPNFGEDKITRAYDYGSKSAGNDFKAGAAAISQTITYNFGVDIDAAIMTTFDGFAQIVNALGGVTVSNPYDVYDAEYPTADYGIKEIYFPAGVITLSGEEALEFCRTRHQDGDDGRSMRQRIVLRALLDTAKQSNGLSLQELVNANRSAYRTNLGRSKQLALALAAPDFSNDSVSFTTLQNHIYPSTASNGAWIYAGDWSQIPGYVQGFLDGSIEGNA
jgi:polyisoprenyl-teichoic acid--peptidoglycan teichoic acid transferase